MNILVAMDSFKGSLNADAVCRAVARGIEDAGHVARCLPIADGGEGTAAAMLAARGGEWIECRLTGPLPDTRVATGYGWFADDRTAVVEMAAVSGLTLIDAEQRDPTKTSTYGTGQLIAVATAHGAELILLGVGGSATVDGGIGAAAALGWRFLDKKGRNLKPVGDNLGSLAKIEPPPHLVLPPIKVLCDVRNPLNGPDGAARVYAPQKGADSAAVAKLESGLLNLTEIVQRDLGTDMGIYVGGGAAGGLAAGAVAFMGAQLAVGIDAVLDALHFDEALNDIDLVVTGEGRFDCQSLFGKAVAGVAKRASAAGIPVAVLAGSVDVDPKEYRPLGIVSAHSLVSSSVSVEQAMRDSRELLRAAARELPSEDIAG